MRLSATVLQIKGYLHVKFFIANFLAKNGLRDPLKVEDKWTDVKSRRRKGGKISSTLQSIHCENKNVCPCYLLEKVQRDKHSGTGAANILTNQRAGEPASTNQRP